jgi:hypothetical protein
MWVWVYSRSHPFSYPAWCIQLYCGRSTCGCLAVYFPGIKVGKMYLFLFFLFECLVVLVINRDIVRSTITPELDAVNWNSFSWGFCLPTNWVRVHLGVFVYPVSKSSLNFSIAERLQVRPSFVPYNFVCGFTSNLKYKHFWTLNTSSKVQLEFFFFFPKRNLLVLSNKSCSRNFPAWRLKKFDAQRWRHYFSPVISFASGKLPPSATIFFIRLTSSTFIVWRHTCAWADEGRAKNN